MIQINNDTYYKLQETTNTTMNTTIMNAAYDNDYDIHFWIYDSITKSIIDPYFEEYDFVKMVRNLTDKQRYEEIEYQSKKYMEYFLRVLPRIKHHKNNLPSGYGRCWFNAWRVKQQDNKRYRLCIGKMGWEKKTGGVWWEFG